ncbi:unnamed protein product [Bemisia tabaci]|uniref:Uncharacterized protein n=1 Tax=Bemisia tabaci TaxID=7038 RepID=A0A9P0AHI3_BEMTA|nr:unnamed protein product [Bemisia tabaci]
MFIHYLFTNFLFNVCFQWTALWPLLGGIGCLAELVSFQAEDVVTEAPKLSLFIQNEPLQPHRNHSDSYLQSFSHKILNDALSPRNNSSHRRAKSDLRSRPREGRGKVDDVDNYQINSLSSSNSNADQYKPVHDSNHEQSQQQNNFVYSSFYENHPLIQKLTDTKPQKFLAGDSHVVEEELASAFSPEKGIPLPLQGNNLNVDSDSWTPAWYTNLYEAGKNYNDNSQTSHSNDTKPKSSSRDGSESWKPADSEYRESRYPQFFATAATVPSVSPSTDSSFNVGYSIGVSNSQDPRNSRMLFKINQPSEIHAQPAYSSPLQRPPSQTPAPSSSRRPEFSPEIITGKPEASNQPEPYRYELVGDDTVWKHLTPNVEMSLSTTARPHYSHDSLPKPQNTNHNVVPTNGHTTPSSADGQAFYYYTGNKGGGDKPGPSSFDHNHALGQSNNFDFSNAMVTLPANLAASGVASQQTAERGYESVAEHIQRENKKFEAQLKVMLEGRGKVPPKIQLVADNALAAQTLRPRNVSLPHAKPKKTKPDPHHPVLKNSIQSVIIPLPNGKSLHMPAIIIPLGPVPGFEMNQVAATSSPVVQVTSPPAMHVLNPSGSYFINPSGLQVVNPLGVNHIPSSSGFHISNPPSIHHASNSPSIHHGSNSPGIHHGSNSPSIHHGSNSPSIHHVSNPSGIHQVSIPSGTHFSNPPVFQHASNPPGYQQSNPSGAYASYPPNSVHLANPTRIPHSHEENKFDEAKQFTRGNTGGNRNYLPQRPQAPKVVKLQQPKLKKPKNLNVGVVGGEETQVIHVMPKYNQASPTQHSPTASSYVYYTVNENPTHKQQAEHENPLLAAGSSLLNAVLLPFEKDSSESFDLSTEATEYIPATSYQNFLRNLNHEPLKLSHAQVDDVTPSEAPASTVQPGEPDLSIPSNRKRKTRSKKRKKTGASTTTAAPGNPALNPAVAASVVEPEYAYGYGLIPFDESYANLYSTLQNSFPSKGSLSYHQPPEKPSRDHQPREPSRDHHPREPSRDHHPREPSRDHQPREPSRDHQPKEPTRDHQRKPSRGYPMEHPRQHAWDQQRDHSWDSPREHSQEQQHSWDQQREKSQDSPRRPARGHVRHHSHDHMLDYMNSLNADTNEYFPLTPERDATKRVQMHRSPSSMQPAFQRSVVRRRFIY